MNLIDLIANDLEKLARFDIDRVLSEEAIRFMIAMYERQGKLNNPRLTKKNDLSAALKRALDISALRGGDHFQFIVEVSNRSPLLQNDPAGVHYCALDLFVNPGQTPLAFIANHHAGFAGFFEVYAEAAKTLGIHFVIAGGAYLQADSVHCPIFTLYHLLISAKDKGLRDFLKLQITDITTSKTEIHWKTLAPNYLLPSQTVSFLMNYVNEVKAKENSAPELPSAILESHQFERELQKGLYVHTIGDAKVLRNEKIRYLAAELAGDARIMLDEIDSCEHDLRKVKMSDLISICYQEAYPRVHERLEKALFLSADGDHPLFKLAFSHALVLEACFKDSKFSQSFNNKVLELMLHGLMDPYKLFNYLYLSDDIKSTVARVDRKACDRMAANLKNLEPLLELLPKLNGDLLFEVLISPNTQVFFKNKVLTDLLLNAYIPLSDISRIVPWQIDQKCFGAHLTDSQNLEYLNKKFNLYLPVRSTQDLEIEDEDSLFNVPEVSIVENQRTEREVNDYLIKSLTKNLFRDHAEKENNEEVKNEDEYSDCKRSEKYTYTAQVN